MSMPPAKALEAIGAALQLQYERWQPRARYRQSLDPTAEDVKKLCTSLRRNAKEERMLFHYNGHGVPKPTANGEIWVFNRVILKNKNMATLQIIIILFSDIHTIHTTFNLRFANLDGGTFDLCI